MDFAVTWSPILFILLYAVLIAMSIVSVRASTVDPAGKVAWIALIVVAPVLGTLLWLLIGRRLAGAR